jgi:acyl-CoA thioester hydrolase
MSTTQPPLPRQAMRGEIRTDVSLRYSDMDVMGHLNNAVYSTFFEAGRVAFIHEVLPGLTPKDTGYVIVKLTVEFLAEARYPGTVQIFTRISRVGGSSMTYQQEVVLADKTIARGESICAMFDLTRRKAMRCPQNMRDVLILRGATNG